MAGPEIEYEQWAAMARERFNDRDARYDYTPSAAMVADFEKNISITGCGWLHELEERAERATQRRHKLLKAVPVRAGEVAIVAEGVGVIADADAWREKTATTGGTLVLSGPVGTGKTVGAARVCWMHINSTGSTYTFVRAAELAAMSRYGEEREKFRKHKHLIVDDLGAEYLDKGGSFLTDLDELFDRFYAERMHLVVTTNLPRAAFAKRYGQRVTDRITEAGTWITVTGESRRKAGA